MTETASGQNMPTIETLRHELSFLNIEFNIGSRAQIVAIINHLSRSRSHSYLVTPNVDHVVKLDSLPDIKNRKRFIAAYRSATIRLCDSKILSALARLKGIDLPVFPGSDLTSVLITEHFGSGTNVAIIGGTEESLEKLRALFPLPNYMQHIPPMGVLRSPDAIAAIPEFLAQVQADYVLMAIGAPQSEIVAELCTRDGRFGGISLCIGASIEFLTGEKQRAPARLQRLGLEWAYRLVTEPGRLWRRYLVEGPRIFMIFMRGGLR